MTLALAMSQSGAPVAGVIAAIDRLSETVSEETRALRTQGAIDLEPFTHQKNQGMLEITRALRAAPAQAESPAVVERLTRLRAVLDENLIVVGAHLAAAREIADVVSEAVEDAESDGTYSDMAPRGARR